MPRSLRVRLVLFFSVGTTAVLLLCLWLLNNLLDNQFDSALTSELLNRRAAVLPAVQAGDTAGVARFPFAQLYAADGTVIAGSPGLGSRRLLTPVLVKALDGDTWLDLELPIGTGGATVPVEVLASPVNGTANVLAVGINVEVVDAATDRQRTALLIAAPLLTAALIGAGWLVVRAALRPVERLSREAAAISSLESDRRLPRVPGGDELATLAKTLNQMLDRLQVAFARERAFVDDASHELRTPLTVLRGELELALGALDDRDEVERSLVAARQQAERLSALAENLLLLARDRAGGLVVDRRPVDLLDLVAEEARVLGPALGLRITATGEPVVADVDPARLRQILANAAANSAAAGASHLRFEVGHGPAGVRLECADDGPGVPPQLVGSVFERFVRGDAARSTSGAGLGLSIVRAIAAAHDGTVEIRNGPPLGGAVLIVHLPV